MTIHDLLSLLKDTKKNSGGWMAKCPGHEDNTPSLSVTQAGNKILLNCRAQCDTEDVVAALGIKMADLFTDPKPDSQPKTIYDYQDEAGNLLFQVVRTTKAGKKVFFQQRIFQDGKVEFGLGDSRRVIYRLPKVREASAAGKIVMIVEGEKDVQTLELQGFTATTNPGGVGMGWRPDYTDMLKGVASVVIIPDHDEPGKKHAGKVALSLTQAGIKVRVVSLPGLPTEQGGKDVTDWVEQCGGDRERLREIVKATAVWEVTQEEEKKQAAEEVHTHSDLVSFNLTDSGNAERIKSALGSTLRYYAPQEAWYSWTDSTGWAEIDPTELQSLARDVMRRAADQARTINDDEIGETFKKFCRRSENLRPLQAAIQCSIPEMRCDDADRPDGLPWLLKVDGKRLDLRTGETGPLRRDEFLTRRLDVQWLPGATCELWQASITRWMAGDAELINYLQRLAGLCLTADITEQSLFFFYGHGANGKSTFLNVLLALLGDVQDGGYAVQAPSDLLLQNQNDDNATKLADLFGARLVVSQEPNVGKRMDEGLVKSLTGGDKIVGRHLYKRAFRFAPTHKIILSANHKPTVRGQEDAIWRRLKLIPWTVTINESEKDLELQTKLLQELPGILQWAVVGAVAWNQAGLQHPKQVLDATYDYKDENNPAGEWLETRTEVGPFEVSFSAIYKDYLGWVENVGESQKMTRKTFAQFLTDQGVESVRGTKGEKMRHGLRLIAPPFVFSSQPEMTFRGHKN